MAWLVIISFIVLVPATIASRIFANQVYRYIKQHYPELWTSINTPNSPAEYAPFFSKRGSFLLKHEYKRLKDKKLNLKAQWAILSFQIMLGSLVIMLLSALSYEFLKG